MRIKNIEDSFIVEELRVMSSMLVLGVKKFEFGDWRSGEDFGFRS